MSTADVHSPAMVPVRPDQTARVATELGGSVRYYEPWLLRAAEKVDVPPTAGPTAAASGAPTSPPPSSSSRLWIYVTVGGAAALATFLVIRHFTATKRGMSPDTRGADVSAHPVPLRAPELSPSASDELGTWERVESGGFAATAPSLARVESPDATASSIGCSMTSNATATSGAGSFVAAAPESAARSSGRPAVRVTSDDDFVMVEHHSSPVKQGAREAKK